VANIWSPTRGSGLQNQTDDFTGFIAHSANLALKGTSHRRDERDRQRAGNAADATHYLSVARAMQPMVSRAEDRRASISRSPTTRTAPGA